MKSNKPSKDEKFLSVEKFAEGQLSVAPYEYTVQEVEVNLDSEVLSAYVNELFSNLQFAVESRGGSVPFTHDELLNYIKALIASRIAYTRGEGGRKMVGPTSHVAVPSYISVLLDNIGRAVDQDLGVELLPSAVESPLTLEEVTAMSGKLKVLGHYGFEYGTGFSRDRHGSWDFMAMTLVDGEIRRHNQESHPVYALLASTLSLKGVEAVLSPRVTYGNERHLSSVVRGLASLKA